MGPDGKGLVYQAEGLAVFCRTWEPWEVFGRGRSQTPCLEGDSHLPVPEGDPGSPPSRGFSFPWQHSFFFKWNFLQKPKM